MGIWIVAATAFSVASAAPQPADVGAQDIVVIARKPTDAKLVRSVIRSIARPTDVGGGDFQMARWIDPVCPIVLGLADPDARILEDDIRAVAAKVGAPVGTSSCAHNIEIIVTSDPRSSLLDEQKRQPWFFRGLPKADVAEMIDGSGAVRWASATKTYSADGTPMRLDGSVADADGSSLHAATQTGLGRMIVIVDRNKVAALSTDTLHDYIALVALAQLNMKPIPTDPDTILNVTTSDTPRDGGLRPFDLAYLKALYAVGPNLHGSAQQLAMTRKVSLLLNH